MMLPSGIDDDTLRVAPVSVLRRSHVRSGQAPGLSNLVGVVDPDVGRAADGPRVAFGHWSEVYLDAIACREAVPSALVLACCKPESL